MEKFKEENRDFYAYYKAGCTCEDEKHFTRACNDLGNLLVVRVYDMDERASTSHDHLIANVLALEEYEKYVEEKLKDIKNFQ